MYQQMSAFLENVDNSRLLLITSAGQRYAILCNYVPWFEKINICCNFTGNY